VATNFLHLSDLHFRPGWNEECGLVSEKAIEDINNQLANYPDSYLIFSGDISYSGGDSTLHGELIREFFDKINIPKERRIVVPGNHDLARSEISLALKSASLAGMTSECLFNDNVAKLSQFFFEPEFSNYIKLENDIAKYTCCGSSVGGEGWELDGDIGIYCLNSALGSFGGLSGGQGGAINDKGRLLIDTRSVYGWLSTNASSVRILVMHHPIDWYVDWAQVELEKIIYNNFNLVMTGHVHKGASRFSSSGPYGAITCTAPALFSRKSDELGYAFISIDALKCCSSIHYRQWTQGYEFVDGNSLSGTDNGRVSYPFKIDAIEMSNPQVDSTRSVYTIDILREEFEEAIYCYSSKNNIWVDRDLSSLPETESNREGEVITPIDAIAESPKSCIVRAPIQFGLSSLGRRIALRHAELGADDKTIVYVDIEELPVGKLDIARYIDGRCQVLKISLSGISAFVIDNFTADKKCSRVFGYFKDLFPGVSVILLCSVRNFLDIANAVDYEGVDELPTYYLHALTRRRVRELVVAYAKDIDGIDDDFVTGKIVQELESINIHRTPLNCLLLLKLAEHAFEDSPVNRTEMIQRVLYMLFVQFNKIPRYVTRPDLKDCEYALGYVAEWLLRSSRVSFSKSEFTGKIGEYCKTQLLDLDSEILFVFLLSENILTKKGQDFEFRFSYWLYFFAAHRMHHNDEFSNYILSDKRYSAFPEIIEFYTGIDRRRSNAIRRVTDDLCEMNEEFLKRTGISDDFNPFDHAIWNPSQELIEELHRLVTSSVNKSLLPQHVKDAIADKTYDRQRPYHQDVAKYVDESTLIQMVSAMKGAARALRNSDHVSPVEKMKLLDAVLVCWKRVCQILVILSPMLASEKYASFEGMGFVLASSFDKAETNEQRWGLIMNLVINNVVNWFKEDLSSKKMGALFSGYIGNHQNTLSEVMILMIMVKLRPIGWHREVESYIVRSSKNSFYLSRLLTVLEEERHVGFVKEDASHQLLKLSAMTLAKHQTGAKHPNLQLVKKMSLAMSEEETAATGRRESKPYPRKNRQSGV